MSERKLARRVAARETRDGDGVRIHRIAGPPVTTDFDPFLLLDELHGEEGADYVGGFPPHPHRGFETLTYMLHGGIRHRDHLGNEGLLRDGGVQWMTAGRGVVHSEMPEQTDGLLHGFQLWLNLAAGDKMQPPRYADFGADQIPGIDLGHGHLRLIAGAWEGVTGPVATGRTAARILDVELEPAATVEIPAPSRERAAFYPFLGATTELGARQLGFYTGGDRVRIRAGGEGVRGLFLAGTPLGEPVHQCGPFVMNSVAEVEQAIRDYNKGTLTDPPERRAP